jgi:hypothetical protein
MASTTPAGDADEPPPGVLVSKMRANVCARMLSGIMDHRASILEADRAVRQLAG